MSRHQAAKRMPEEERARELEITRVFDATRAIVFKAWTEPERIKSWWGPKGFTLPFCKIDLRPGGVCHYCMRSPEGRDYWGKSVYQEIVEPERLVLTDVFSDEKGNTVKPAQYGMSPDWPEETLITVIFDEYEGKTRLTVRQSVPESIAESTGARQGWTESLDRLEKYLSK